MVEGVQYIMSNCHAGAQPLLLLLRDAGLHNVPGRLDTGTQNAQAADHTQSKKGVPKEAGSTDRSKCVR